MKKLFFYLITFHIFFLLCINTVTAWADGGIPTPQGIYVVTKYGNNPLPDGSDALPKEFEQDPTFRSSAIAGLAIYIPLATLLPDPLPTAYANLSWEQLFDPENTAFHDWDWSYLDKMLTIALENRKSYSVTVVTGFQNAGTKFVPPRPTRGYLKSIGVATVPSFIPSFPSWFENRCNPSNQASYYPPPSVQGDSPWSRTSCAPTFNIYDAATSCLSYKIPLPWNKNVQKFWGALANALANHLKHSCYNRNSRSITPCDQSGHREEGRRSVYEHLTLVHLPGLSIFDEELMFPHPKPLPNDLRGICPDGRSITSRPTNGQDWAYNAISYDNSWTNLIGRLGYTEYPPTQGRPATSNLIEGFKIIAGYYIRAFPDRVVGLSPLNNVNGVDLPNFKGYFKNGGVSHKIIFDIAEMIRSTGSGLPLELQSDDEANIFWDPHGNATRMHDCSTPTCADPRFPWVNPQHFFSGLNAIYGWQEDVGGVVKMPSGEYLAVARCMLASTDESLPYNRRFCLDSTDPSDIERSFYGLLKFGYGPNFTPQAWPVKYMEIFPADVLLRPNSIRQAVANGWFAVQRNDR